MQHVMSFDFRTEYAAWTDDALRALLQQAESYQPSAVAAAEAILRERGVPLYVPPPVEPTARYNLERDSILEPLLKEKPQSFFWPQANGLRVLFVLTAAMVVYWLVAGTLLPLYHYFVRGGYLLSARIYSLVLFSLLEVLGLYLAARRDPWGWYILALGCWWRIVLQLFTLYFIFRMRYDGMAIYKPIVFNSVPALTVGTGILLRAVRNYFGIAASARWKVLLAALLLALVLWFI